MRVLKVGGNELDREDFLGGLARAVVAMGEPVVIVHGGGRSIAELQARLGLRTVKVDGLRVTDPESLHVAEMVLSGQVNKRIVRALLAAGVDALGLSGVDRGLLRCRRKIHPKADLGCVGEIVRVRVDVIGQLEAANVTPVISPISLGFDGQSYNVNADNAAAAIAAAIRSRLIDFVSNVPGVLNGESVIPLLTAIEVERLVSCGVIRDGMLPKVLAALAAVDQGVRQARIVDLNGLVNEAGTTFVL